MICYFRYEPKKKKGKIRRTVLCEHADEYKEITPLEEEFDAVFVILEGNLDFFGESKPVFTAIEQNGVPVVASQCEYAARRTGKLEIASNGHHGGGHLKVRNKMLILLDGSCGYGRLSKEALMKLRTDLCHFFRVRKIMISSPTTFAKY